MFPDAPSIHPYLENPGTGPTSTFCAELARRLECYVTAGFPERLEHSDSQPLLTTSATIHPSLPAPVGANTAVLYGPTGKLLSLYRKSNLFRTDLSWATAGHGFTVIDLPLPLGKTSIAICNDLNPQAPAVWDSLENGPYELAKYCMREGTRLLVLLNAWLSDADENKESGDEGSDEEGSEDQMTIDTDDDLHQEPDWSVLRWWSARLRPTWARDRRDEQTRHPRTDCIEHNDLAVVLCNRSGRERGVVSIPGPCCVC